MAQHTRVLNEDQQYALKEFAFLISCGEDPERAAQRLGYTLTTIDRLKHWAASATKENAA